jgi:hypothetical protein
MITPELIANMQARITSTDFADWQAKVTASGGCAKPIILTGSHAIKSKNSGQVLHGRSGTVFAPCNSRRESICPSCSRIYSGDAFQLIRSGVSGDSKGIPASIATHPRAFVTLTAPSFGAVHARRVSARGFVIPCVCGAKHREGDPNVSTAVDRHGYDYEQAVLWNNHAGELWNAFTKKVVRYLASAVGMSLKAFAPFAGVSFAKVAEFQKRGLVHFHSVIRIDGPLIDLETRERAAPGSWATTELLEDAIRWAASQSIVSDVPLPDGECFDVVWGRQVDVKPIAAGTKEGVSDGQLAGYIAKYSTKGTGTSEMADRRIRHETDLEEIAAGVHPHFAAMLRTAWELGGLEGYEDRRLRLWSHMLGFRGHFLTKSRRYSLRFADVRDARKAFTLRRRLDELGVSEDEVIVVNDWRAIGHGHSNTGDVMLAKAIGESLHDRRQRNGGTDLEIA